jgi:hypothetical protein
MMRQRTEKIINNNQAAISDTSAARTNAVFAMIGFHPWTNEEAPSLVVGGQTIAKRKYSFMRMSCISSAVRMDIELGRIRWTVFPVKS